MCQRAKRTLFEELKITLLPNRDYQERYFKRNEIEILQSCVE